MSGEEARAVIEVLEKCEWIDDDCAGYCVCCLNGIGEGHTADCKLNELLKLARVF